MATRYASAGDTMNPAADADSIIDELTRRATVAAYHEYGSVPAAEISRAADALRVEAVELLRRGYDLHADAALRLAERLDETAELATLLQRRRAA